MPPMFCYAGCFSGSLSPSGRRTQQVLNFVRPGMRRTAPASPSSNPPDSSSIAGSVIVRSVNVAATTNAIPVSAFISLPVTTFSAADSYFAAGGAQAIGLVQLMAQIRLNHKDLRPWSTVAGYGRVYPSLNLI